MKGKGRDWVQPSTEPAALRKYGQYSVQLRTYAGEMLAWYVGSRDATSTSARSGRARTFRVVFMKDVEGHAHPNYTISSNMTAEMATPSWRPSTRPSGRGSQGSWPSRSPTCSRSSPGETRSPSSFGASSSREGPSPTPRCSPRPAVRELDGDSPTSTHRLLRGRSQPDGSAEGDAPRPPQDGHRRDRRLAGLRCDCGNGYLYSARSPRPR